MIKYHEELLPTCKKDGWMDENEMKVWLEKVRAKRPGVLLRKPALLVCDQFKSHVTEATKRKIKDLTSNWL
jgi:hypothetical protein